MKKSTAALLLSLSFLTLLGGISVTKGWLASVNINKFGACVFSEEAQKDPATRRVCLKGGCILYSDWIKMSDEERAAIKKG